MSIWETLGIASTPDEGAIRKAYAARVRQWRPDTHPQEFARLREAYEAALDAARRAAPPAQQSAAPRQPLSVPDTLPARDIQPPPPPPPTPSPQVAADALVAELARRYSEQGEREAVLLLRAQYEALSQQTIDARLDWELVFLHSLLAATAPPMALLFEGDRLLDWRRRGADMAQMFGPEAAERLRLLLDLAYESTYARFFSPNRWHARLWGAGRLPWIGLLPHVDAARRLAAWWRQQARAAGREELAEQLDARVLRRVGGHMLWSTDVLFALLAAWVVWFIALDALGPDRPWAALARAALAFASVLPLPWLARWLRGTRAVQRVLGWGRLAEGIPFAIRAIAIGVLVVMGLIAWISDGPLGVRVAGGAIVALASATAILLFAFALWVTLRAMELLLCLPWLWLQRTWGLHAFDGVLEGRGMPGWRAQLRHLPRAVAASWRQWRAQRKAQAERQRQARQLQKTSGGGGFNYWWIVMAIAVLQVLARLAK